MNPGPDQIDMMSEDELRAELRRLLPELHAIAGYDKDSKFGAGICPYGCDCPYIAQEALKPVCNNHPRE